MTRQRWGDDYGESDAGMRWLQKNDPDALRDDYAGRFGIIDHAASRQIRRKEVWFSRLEMIEEATYQERHDNG